MPKLKQVAAEIEEQHGRSTRVVEADFTQGSEIYASIDAALQGLEIGILVNNVGMTYAPRPVNFLDVRDPEKVFVDFFSRSLEVEYRAQGIIVQSVLPLLVSTNMTHNICPSLYVKTADDFAREALNTVGISNQRSGCLSHYLQSLVCALLLPDWLRLSPLGLKLSWAMWEKFASQRPYLKQE
uniref:Uncharacterized protein n=1 Tax=Pelodiscus sinensis TaxID=13735 RepID=K7FFJ3_PELSI